MIINWGNPSTDESEDLFTISDELASRANSSSKRARDTFEIVKPDDAWEVNIPNGHDTTLHNMSITVYGYNAGGLMDQMMAYSKEITPSYAPQLDTNAPTQEEAEVFINDKTADDSTLSF